VHVHEPFAPSSSLFATISAEVPIVATFHASVQSRTYRIGRIPLRPLWKKIAVKIAVSQAARDTVEGIFGPGARIIPNGVDVAQFSVTGPPPKTGKEVLYFGRLEHRKGPQVLVEALPALFKAVPDAHVVIAGEGPLREKLENAVPKKLRQAVLFTGPFDDTDRLALLSAATVVALPALGGESFGITLAEAMAAGRRWLRRRSPAIRPSRAAEPTRCSSPRRIRMLSQTRSPRCLRIPRARRRWAKTGAVARTPSTGPSWPNR
jgi:phosphatidylinositol alpha-mannosyltransferase